MGCYDTVLVPCPDCGEEADFQSKSGDCILNTYTLKSAPADVLVDVNRHAPVECFFCSLHFSVQLTLETHTVTKMVGIPVKSTDFLPFLKVDPSPG